MHIDPKALEEALLRFGEQSEASPTLERTLSLLVDATRAVFKVDGSGLMFLDDSQVLRYVVATDERAALLEKVQEETGQGPCVQSLVDDSLVATPDVTADDRWPLVARALAGDGVRAVLGVPVHLGASAVGSLNAYAAEDHQWDESEESAIRAFALVAEEVIGSAVLARQQSELVDQLQRALDNRVDIDRAIGVIMGVEDLDAAAAFEHLRRTARSTRRRVAELAAEILATRSLDVLDMGDA